jgi:hypothetical protein
MAVPSTTIKNSYTLDGSQTLFPFTFKVFAAGDITVKIVDQSTGDETLLVIGTDYSVEAVQNDYSNGGNVTLVDAGTSGDTLVIYREMDLIQEQDYTENDDLPAETLESGFDKAVMMIQQLDERIRRDIGVPITDDEPAELPNAIDRAGLFMAFDSNGDPIASSGNVPAGVAVTAYMETLLDDADAATARTTLDVYSKSEADALVEDHLEKQFTLQESASAGSVVLARGSSLVLSHAPTETVQASNLSEFNGIVLLSKTTVIHVYEDAGTTYFRAGTIAAALTVSWGTAQTITATCATGGLRVVRLSDTAFLAVWEDTVDLNIQGIVGTVSGNAITLGTETQLTANQPRSGSWVDVAVLSATAFIISFCDTNNTDYLTVLVSSISGTTITPGSSDTNTTAGYQTSICVMGTDECLVVWRASATVLWCARVTISGTTPTLAGPTNQTFPTASTLSQHFVRKEDDDNATLIHDTIGNGDAYYYTRVRRSRPGTSFFMPEDDYQTIDQGESDQASALKSYWFDSNGEYAALFRVDGATNTQAMNMTLFSVLPGGLMAGTRFAIGVAGTNSFTGVGYQVSVYDGLIAIAYYDSTGDDVSVQILQLPVVIGVATETGTTPKVRTNGYISGLSGLTPGLQYYVDPLGNVVPAETFPGSYLGKAISATEVIR